MGSKCVCPSAQSPLTPRIAALNSRRSGSGGEGPQYVDIVPAGINDIIDSEADLLWFNQELGQCLRVLEQPQGAISNSQFPPLQFTVKQPGKMSNSSIADSLSTVKNRQLLFVNLEAINSQLQVEDNCQGSFYSESRCASQKQESCLLTQSSRILSGSLFTDRQEAKEQFYSQFNQLGETSLGTWTDSTRLSLVIDEKTIVSLENGGRYPLLMVCLQGIAQYYSSHYLHLMAYSLTPVQGLRLYFNGRKRLLPFAEPSQKGQPSLKQLVQTLGSHMGRADVSSLFYHLTGWIPQELDMAEVRSFQGIFERLSSNVQEGNTVVFFTQQLGDQSRSVLLVGIDMVQGLITVDPCGTRGVIPEQVVVGRGAGNQLVLKVQQFVVLFDAINLCWSPAIYDFVLHRELTLSSQNGVARYSLVIPPSSQDIEIRLLLEQHHSQIKIEPAQLVVKLYEYESLADLQDSSPIRYIEFKRKVFSDVFIFEACKEKTKYLLTVEPKDCNTIANPTSATITFLSFAQMSCHPIDIQPLIAETQLETEMSSSRQGFGINSPYFLDNMQFLVQAQAGQELIIKVDASTQLHYQICLVPNPQNLTVLTKLNLQDIINHSHISSQKQGKGSFSIPAAVPGYFLIINAFSSYEGPLNIKLQLQGKRSPSNALLTIRQLPTIVTGTITHSFQWLATHSGPRRRLKSNCNNQFQPKDTFAEFFNNPYFDRHISNGKYQFYVHNQTFKQHFDTLGLLDKNECQPPALSMSIFSLSQEGQSYRIVQDDAFYVPFGIGFWTKQLQLEEGTYRFVFPKIDKADAIGSFGIIACTELFNISPA